MNSIRIGLVILSFIAAAVGVRSQVSVAQYSFDACDASSPSLGDISLEGNPACECGIGMNSFRLDGVDDIARLPARANDFLNNDVTFDLYFWMEERPGETDIFSHRFGCNSLDSLMALRYMGDTKEFLFELASDVNNYHSVRFTVDPDQCWHRFTLVRFGLEYRVYFDNILAKKIVVREEIIFSKRARLVFADSPCNANNNASRFRGRIDEIQLFDGALSDQALRQNFRYPDRIRTENTTIFQGQSIILETGVTCDDPVAWTPVTGLDNPTAEQPLLTPLQTSTYTMRVNHGTCTSKDTIRVFVADKDKLDCDNLLLPKAFTPNNDGLNDRYGISNGFLVEKLDFFEIYNRSGAKVWETSQLDDTWDGTSKGERLSGGIYLYKIQYNCSGEVKNNIGTFTLMR